MAHNGVIGVDINYDLILLAMFFYPWVFISKGPDVLLISYQGYSWPQPRSICIDESINTCGWVVGGSIVNPHNMEVRVVLAIHGEEKLFIEASGVHITTAAYHTHPQLLIVLADMIFFIIVVILSLHIFLIWGVIEEWPTKYSLVVENSRGWSNCIIASFQLLVDKFINFLLSFKLALVDKWWVIFSPLGGRKSEYLSFASFEVGESIWCLSWVEYCWLYFFFCWFEHLQGLRHIDIWIELFWMGLRDWNALLGSLKKEKCPQDEGHNHDGK